jgi:hypothetical protein
MPESASGAPGYYRLHPIGIAGRRGEEIAVVGPAAWAAPGMRRASRRHQRSAACTRKGGLRSLRGCVPNRDECRSPRPFRLGRWSSSDALVSDGAGGQLLGREPARRRLATPTGRHASKGSPPPPPRVVFARSMAVPCESEVAVDQMPVGLQHKAGEWWPHPALEARHAQALLDQQRGADVSQGVKSDARQARARGCRTRTSQAQAADVRECARLDSNL